jgi:hypothetical protein
MARAHGTGPNGVELDLIGQPLHLRPGPAPGVHMVTENTMNKAPHDGKYLLDGHQFRMRAGAPLPPGAEPLPDPNAAPELDEPKAEVTEAPAKRSKGSAPENRAKADEAEKR